MAGPILIERVIKIKGLANESGFTTPPHLPVCSGSDHGKAALQAKQPAGGGCGIQADKKATTDTLIKVMDSARAAGVFDVSIAAQEA